MSKLSKAVKKVGKHLSGGLLGGARGGVAGIVTGAGPIVRPRLPSRGGSKSPSGAGGGGKIMDRGRASKV